MWNTNLHLIKSILAKKRNKKWRIVFKLGIVLANIQNCSPYIEEDIKRFSLLIEWLKAKRLLPYDLDFNLIFDICKQIQAGLSTP